MDRWQALAAGHHDPGDPAIESFESGQAVQNVNHNFRARDEAMTAVHLGVIEPHLGAPAPAPFDDVYPDDEAIDMEPPLDQIRRDDLRREDHLRRATFELGGVGGWSGAGSVGVADPVLAEVHYPYGNSALHTHQPYGGAVRPLHNGEAAVGLSQRGVVMEDAVVGQPGSADQQHMGVGHTHDGDRRRSHRRRGKQRAARRSNQD